MTRPVGVPELVDAGRLRDRARRRAPAPGPTARHAGPVPTRNSLCRRGVDDPPCGPVATPGGAGSRARATLSRAGARDGCGRVRGGRGRGGRHRRRRPGPPLVPGAAGRRSPRAGSGPSCGWPGAGRIRWRSSCTLTSTPDHPALPRGRWVVLRDFLRYGLEEPTGDGEVRISPDVEEGTVSIRLARDGRPAWVKVPAVTVARVPRRDRGDPARPVRSRRRRRWTR